MTAQQIVDIIKIMYDLGGTVEYVPEGEVSNPDICFYHKIDNINVSRTQINALLDGINIPYRSNSEKLRGNTVYISVYI